MFNEQLEKLIEMALIDGMLSDKEREILKRKAVSQGVDEDEFEMVLEAKLYEKQQNLISTENLQNNQSGNLNVSIEQENLSGIQLLFKKITDIENEPKPNTLSKTSSFQKIINPKPLCWEWYSVENQQVIKQKEN